MAVSTNISPMNGYLSKYKECSTSSTAMVPTSDMLLVFPGFRGATAANDVVVRIPIERPGQKLGVTVIQTAVSSAAYYPQIDVAFGNNATDPAWAGRNYTFASGVPSTVEAAWQHFISTAAIGLVTASIATAYMIVLDTAPYACNFGGTSSNITDARENFINVMVGQSSAATVCSHDTLSTAASANVYWVGAVSL